jgi:hypothetical protein
LTRKPSRWSGVGVGVDGGGAVGLPLASATSMIGRCLGFVGHYMSMMNVGSRAHGVPPFYMALCERDILPQERQTLLIRAHDENPFINGDITFLTFSPLIFTS